MQHLLTPQQYRILKNVSRQYVSKMIAKKKVPTVVRKVSTEQVFIVVDDEELQGVNIDSLTE